MDTPKNSPAASAREAEVLLLSLMDNAVRAEESFRLQVQSARNALKLRAYASPEDPLREQDRQGFMEILTPYGEALETLLEQSWTRYQSLQAQLPPLLATALLLAMDTVAVLLSNATVKSVKTGDVTYPALLDIPAFRQTLLRHQRALEKDADVVRVRRMRAQTTPYQSLAPASKEAEEQAVLESALSRIETAQTAQEYLSIARILMQLKGRTFSEPLSFFCFWKSMDLEEAETLRRAIQKAQDTQASLQQELDRLARELPPLEQEALVQKREWYTARKRGEAEGQRIRQNLEADLADIREARAQTAQLIQAREEYLAQQMAQLEQLTGFRFREDRQVVQALVDALQWELSRQRDTLDELDRQESQVRAEAEEAIRNLDGNTAQQRREYVEAQAAADRLTAQMDGLRAKLRAAQEEEAQLTARLTQEQS